MRPLPNEIMKCVVIELELLQVVMLAGKVLALAILSYNSISGHMLLVGGYIKLILAFKFFQRCAKHAAIHKRNMV